MAASASTTGGRSRSKACARASKVVLGPSPGTSARQAAKPAAAAAKSPHRNLWSCRKYLDPTASVRLPSSRSSTEATGYSMITGGLVSGVSSVVNCPSPLKVGPLLRASLEETIKLYGVDGVRPSR